MTSVKTNKYQPTLKLFWLLYLVIIGLYCFEKLIQPESISRPLVIVLCIQLIPLLAFLPTLIKPTARTFQWFCFTLLLYFVVAVINAYTPGKEVMGTVQSVLISLLFIASMMLGRWKMRKMD
jgi:uncharacterized membrane protein